VLSIHGVCLCVCVCVSFKGERNYNSKLRFSGVFFASDREEGENVIHREINDIPQSVFFFKNDTAETSMAVQDFDKGNSNPSS